MRLFQKKLWFTVLFSSLSLPAFSGMPVNKALKGKIPDEFESDGGHSLGFNGGGSAALSGQESVKTNPAMLTFEKYYRVSAGYHWPSYGREFYQAGIVDTKTASFAAGLLYTSSRDKYKPDAVYETNKQRLDGEYDSPIKRRVSLALAQAFNRVSLGVGVQIIEGNDGLNVIRGNTLGIGIGGLLLGSLRFAISAENLANKNIRELAPTTFRAGLAYLLFSGDLTLHLDFKQRQRLLREVLSSQDVSLKDMSNTLPNQPVQAPGNEQMLIPSMSVRIQDLIRVMGGVGLGIDAISRRSLAGGIAVVNQNFSASYLVSKPYLEDQSLHQALNISFEMSL